jgi:hypothetical protein
LPIDSFLSRTIKELPRISLGKSLPHTTVADRKVFRKLEVFRGSRKLRPSEYGGFAGSFFGPDFCGCPQSAMIYAKNPTSGGVLLAESLDLVLKSNKKEGKHGTFCHFFPAALVLYH